MLIGGLLLAMMAGATFFLAPQGNWLTATQAALIIGILVALLGVVLLLRQQQRASRGLDGATHNGRGYTIAGVITLLGLAFLFSLVPLPFPAAWMDNILPLICVALALWLGSRLLRAAAPLDYQRAQRAYLEGNLDAALALLRDLEEKRPDFYGTYHLRAMIQRQRKDYAAAREAANRLVALRPDLYYGYAELGLALLEEARPAEAREPLGRAANLAPELPEGQFNLGMACAEAGDFEGAIPPLKRALRLDLHDAVTGMIARYHLFRALEALGRHAEAEVERRHLRRRIGVLRRWREELDESGQPAGERRQEQALISAIERAIKRGGSS